MNVDNPKELVKVLLENSESRNALTSFIERTISKTHATAPSKLVPVDVLKDAFKYEFVDRIEPGKVPWGDVGHDLQNEMVEYVQTVLMNYEGEDGKQQQAPARAVILKRIKRYYRSQRQQAVVKNDKDRRRRQRFLNRKNRLTMEKRDAEIERMVRSGHRDITSEEIKEIRTNIPPVQNQEVGRIPDSDDEEAKEDLARRRNINLANGRRIARSNQQRARRILDAISAKRPGEQLRVSEILDMATKNVPATHDTVRQKQVNRADASLTPLKSCSGENAKAVLQSHEKRGRLALNKNARSKADSTCTATCSGVCARPSQDQADLLFTAGAIRTSATFPHPISYVVPDCDLSSLDDFCPQDDFL